MPGGAAALSGEIKVGDQLHAVDGKSVSQASTADTMRMILGAPGSQVTLVISNPPAPVASFEGAGALAGRLQCVQLQRNANTTGGPSGVGISFQKAAGVVGPFDIVGVSDDGAAARSGKIRVGDALHGIDNLSVHPLETDQAVQLILGAPGSEVTLWMQPAPGGSQHPAAAAAEAPTPAPPPPNESALFNDGLGSVRAEASPEVEAMAAADGVIGNSAVVYWSDDEVHSDEEDVHHTTKSGKYLHDCTGVD